MSARPGDTFHRYRLDVCIGVGGMAQVFRATALGAEGFEKSVAIKRVLPSLAGEGFQRRFVDEAKLTAQLSHPNIVQIVDFGRADGSLYIVMELVDGMDLSGLLARLEGDAVPMPAAIQIALATCRGLEHAHAHGVVHRDISPSNILLSTAGAVKVADFGIARANDGSQTSPRELIGKLRYMSPEQTRGEALDVRSDVFSAGIVFHELIASRRLFRAGTLEEVVDAVAHHPIPPLADIRPDCPRGIDDIVGRMLERDPEARYTRFRDLERALMEVCLDGGILSSEFDVAEVVAAAAARAPRGRDAQVRNVLGRAGERPMDHRVTEGATSVSAHGEVAGRDPTGATLCIGPGARPEGGMAPLWSLEVPAGDRAQAPGATRAEPPAGSSAAGGARRWVVIAAALAVAAAATWAASSFGSAPARGEPDAGRLAVAAPLDDAAVERAPSVDAPPTLADDADATPERPEQTAGEPAPRRQPAPRLEARRTHVIQISAVPWAHVYLGGRRLGTSPSKRRFRVLEGTHVLVLKNPELGVSRRVTVTSPSEEVFRFDLRDGAPDAP